MSTEYDYLDEFGGWLYFFYITNILGLIICILGMLSLIYIFTAKPMRTDFAYFDAVVFSIILIFSAKYYYSIIRNVKDKELETPDKIYKYLKGLLIITIISTIFGAFKHGQYFLDRSIRYDFSIIQSIISIGVILIWGKYFKISIRVKKYYGKNTELA